MKFNLKKRTICTIMAIYMVLLNVLCIPCSAASYTYFTNKYTPNYTTTNLDNLYNSSGSITSSWYDRIYEAGCFVTSYAMILNNLGQTTKTKVTDIRSSEKGYLEADPFTVTYANAGFPSISPKSGKYLASYSSDPVYTNASTIASNFDSTYAIVNLSGKTATAKVYNLAYYINEYSQGVGIYFSNSSAGTHLIVGVKSTYPLASRSVEEIVAPVIINNSDQCSCDDPTTFASVKALNGTLNTKSITTDMTYESYFTVCDPVSYYEKSGDNVLMDECWTATTFDFNDIQSIRLMY